MNYEFNVTTRLTYMFVIASVSLLVFTFLFGLHLGESIARQSLVSSTPVVVGGSVLTSPEATGASSLRRVNGAVRDAQNALKVPKLPSVSGLPSNIPLEVGN